MSATGGQYEKRNTITPWIELISLFLSPGSMWTVKQLLVSTVQLRELLVPLALVQVEANTNINTNMNTNTNTGSGSGAGESDAGECPAPSAGGDCAGAVSNCWSPGQRDTGALLIWDGCRF